MKTKERMIWRVSAQNAPSLALTLSNTLPPFKAPLGQEDTRYEVHTLLSLSLSHTHPHIYVHSQPHILYHSSTHLLRELRPSPQLKNGYLSLNSRCSLCSYTPLLEPFALRDILRYGMIWYAMGLYGLLWPRMEYSVQALIASARWLLDSEERGLCHSRHVRFPRPQLVSNLD